MNFYEKLEKMENVKNNFFDKQQIMYKNIKRYKDNAPEFK